MQVYGEEASEEAVMSTYAIVKFNLEDTTAIQKAAFTFTDNNMFGGTAPFRAKKEAVPHGYMGRNQFVLDGSLQEIPDSQGEVGFWSLQKSGADRKFKHNPVMEIKFRENHTSSGLTFVFEGECPKKMKVTWYDLGGDKIAEVIHTPVSLWSSCKMQVKNYARIRLEFMETHFAERCIRLQYVIYGQYITWSGLEVKTAKVTEQIDESNQTQPVNTAQVDIIDENNDFDIANPNGAWNSAEYYQKLTMQEYKDGALIDCGTFYLNGWSFKSNIASFKAVDAVGYLDTVTYREGTVLDHARAKDVIDSVMAAAGWTDYVVDDAIADMELVGYLKKQTCRNALKEICFALGAQATCSRSDVITIRQPDRYIATYVGPDRKFIGKTQVALGDYVAQVSVSLPNYTLSTEPKSVYKAAVDPGTYAVDFSSPIDPTSIQATGGEVSSIHEGYCTLTVKAAGECEITAKTYTSQDFTLTQDVDSLDAGQTAVTKKYTAALYCPSQIYKIMKQLLSYYQLRKTLQMTYLLDKEIAGKWVGVTDTENQVSSALIKEQTIDLTGGFIAQAKCVGYDRVSVSSYFTGKELYAGGDIII